MIKILAIDDNSYDLILLGKIIKDSFPEMILETALSGETGIELAVKGDPDMILLDINMPGMDGFEVCRQLKHDVRVQDIPVIFLSSAKENMQNRINALETGGEAFLNKPFDEPELIAQIRAMVKIREFNRQKRNENERLSFFVAERTIELEQKQLETLNLLNDLKADNESRRKTEKALRKSENLFRNIFEYHTAVKLIIDPGNGNIIDANRAAEKFYGWSKDQLKQMKIQEINIYPDKKISQAIDMALSRKQEYFEFQHRMADGSLRDVEVFSSHIEVDGKLLLHSIVHDISSRKRAETAINISEAGLKRAELASKSGNWELHLDTQHIIGSEGAAAIYGVHEDEIEYELVKKIPLPEYRWMLDEAVKKLMEDEIPYDIEFKIKTVDTGEIKDIHSLALFDKEKRILFGIIQDITDRKRSEETLRRSEEKYRLLLELAPDAFFQGDSMGNFITFNDKAIQLTGFSKEELLHMNMSDLFSEKAMNEEPLRYDLLKSGNTIITERKIRRKSGELIDVEMNSKAMPDDTYQSFLRDITERKRADEVLIESEIRLRELNATKDKFFSIIAHDLKSPFNSIIGFSNLLIEQIQEKDYDGIAEYATIIRNSSQGAMDLLQNLLEWSRSQTGRMEFNPEYVEIVTLIDESIHLLVNSAQQKSIALSKELPRKAIAFADKAMISTILRNLISNAIKFTNPEGAIIISAEQKQNELLISVTDNGVGIKKEVIEKLFRIEEGFSTIGTKNEKGTGLGLILCKEFIEKHGGKIWVESKAGKGSRFCFTIPKS